MSREYSSEEIRTMVLTRMWEVIDYWEAEAPAGRSLRERLAGCVFTVLAELDGSSTILPAFRICPDPHPDDAEYLKSKGENWFPSNHGIELKGEISNIPLHEMFYRYDTKRTTL